MKVVLVGDTSGVVNISCPAGAIVKVESVIVGTSANLAGDQMVIALGKKNSVQFRVTSNGLLPSTGAVGAAVGVSCDAPTLSSIDPVTGAVSFVAADSRMMSLPDVVWDEDVVVSVSVPTGSIDTMSVVYSLLKKAGRSAPVGYSQVRSA